jgi:hypothetical protein
VRPGVAESLWDRERSAASRPVPGQHTGCLTKSIARFLPFVALAQSEAMPRQARCTTIRPNRRPIYRCAHRGDARAWAVGWTALVENGELRFAHGRRSTLVDQRAVDDWARKSKPCPFGPNRDGRWALNLEAVVTTRRSGEDNLAGFTCQNRRHDHNPTASA